MRVISVAQLKGGVSKTTTSVNVAYNLSSLGFRVLLIDNDKQGNSSAFYKVYDDEGKGTHNMLTDKDIVTKDIILQTKYENLDIIPTNMLLLLADKQTMIDTTRPQQTRYKDALMQIKNKYDFCIIDNAPSLDISVINALSVSKDVIVPIKVDEFCAMGLNVLQEQLEDIKTYINNDLENVILFYTYYTKSKVNNTGIRNIIDKVNEFSSELNYKTISSVVRRTIKVDESTFKCEPLQVCFPKTTATKDYIELTNEYLEIVKGDK